MSLMMKSRSKSTFSKSRFEELIKGIERNFKSTIAQIPIRAIHLMIHLMKIITLPSQANVAKNLVLVNILFNPRNRKTIIREEIVKVKKRRERSMQGPLYFCQMRFFSPLLRPAASTSRLLKSLPKLQIRFLTRLKTPCSLSPSR